MGQRATFEQAAPKLLTAIASGASVADASRHVGVAERTVKGWLTRGRREPDSKYGPFAQEADEVRENRPALDTGSEEDLRAACWQAVVNGSIPAMRLYWEMICADQDPETPETPEDFFAQVEQFANTGA